MSDTYSFNNTEELNKIFYDPSICTFVYRQDDYVCTIARHREENFDVYPSGNQFVNRYVEQTLDGEVFHYRSNPRSDKLIRLQPWRDVVVNYLLYDGMNSSMIKDRSRWIERILSAKDKIVKKQVI